MIRPIFGALLHGGDEALLNSGHFCPVQVSRRASIRVHNPNRPAEK